MTFARRRSRSAAARARFGPLINTLIVAGGYLASRLLGLLREVIISAQFGTSPQLDAYRAAFSIPDLIYLVIAGGALGSAFIPVFSAFLAQGDDEGAWRLANGVFRLITVAMLAACALIALLAEPLVALTVGSGFDPERRELTVQIVRLLLIQPFLLGLGGLAKATLESFDRFALPAIGSNLYNLGIIGGALLLAPWMGVFGLVWGVLAGAALFVLVQLPGLRAVGARALTMRTEGAGALTARLGLAAPGVGEVARLLGPRLFGQAAWQVNMIAIASFASLLGSGAVAANAYALQLMMLPHGLIALSMGTVIFPRLARHHAEGDRAALRDAALWALRGVLFWALPAAALLGVLRLATLRALFQRGAFDAASAALTAEALLPYMLGLAGFAVAEIAVRTFYAMHDTRTPVYVGVAAVGLNIALAWSLLRLGLGLGGLALAFGLANTAEAAALIALLRSRLGGYGGLAGALGRMLLAASACVAVLLALVWLSQRALPFLRPGDTYRWPDDFLPLLIWLALAGAAGVATYIGAATLLRLPEAGAALERVGRLLARARR